MADQLIVMRRGRLVAAGTPATLYQAPPNAYTARLLARSNVLSNTEALDLGINVAGMVAIHPEWIHVQADPQGVFRVMDIRFKGFYEELTVGNGRLVVHVIHQEIGAYAAGTSVGLRVEQFHAVK